MDSKLCFEKNAVTRKKPDYSTRYTMGLEIEFIVPNARTEDKFCLSMKGDKDYLILGFDGSGRRTKEFRSPVFLSLNKESCLDALMGFAFQTQTYLKDEFGAVFTPVYHRYNQCCEVKCPTADNGLVCGLHFSLGGLFKNEESAITRRVIDVAKVIKNYINQTDDYSLKVFQERISGHYNMAIPGNGIKGFDQQGNRMEIRIFPSTQVEKLSGFLYYIVTGDSKYLAKQQIISFDDPRNLRNADYR